MLGVNPAVSLRPPAMVGASGGRKRRLRLGDKPQGTWTEEDFLPDTPTSYVGEYTLFGTLGEGSFAKVKLGLHRVKKLRVAVKIMDKGHIQDHQGSNQVRQEILVMKALRHKNIVRMHEVLTSDNKLYIVMDEVSGGDLYDRLQNGALSEDQARMYFHQIIDGVAFCHNNNVVHRDLKPENILLDENDIVKLTDFGFSKLKPMDPSTLLFTSCGTPEYCAPEIILNSTNGYRGAKVDSWACGITLYAMLVGTLPFQFDEDQDPSLSSLYEAITTCQFQYPSEALQRISPPARDLISKILVPFPEERYGISEIKQHPWFRKDYRGDDPRISSFVNRYRESERRQSPTRQSPKRRSPTRRSPTRRSPTRRSPTRRSPTRRSPRTVHGSSEDGLQAQQYMDRYTFRSNRGLPIAQKAPSPLGKLPVLLSSGTPLQNKSNKREEILYQSSDYNSSSISSVSMENGALFTPWSKRLSNNVTEPPNPTFDFEGSTLSSSSVRGEAGDSIPSVDGERSGTTPNRSSDDEKVDEHSPEPSSEASAPQEFELSALLMWKMLTTWRETRTDSNKMLRLGIQADHGLLVKRMSRCSSGDYAKVLRLFLRKLGEDLGSRTNSAESLERTFAADRATTDISSEELFTDPRHAAEAVRRRDVSDLLKSYMERVERNVEPSQGSNDDRASERIPSVAEITRRLQEQHTGREDSNLAEEFARALGQDVPSPRSGGYGSPRYARGTNDGGYDRSLGADGIAYQPNSPYVSVEERNGDSSESFNEPLAKKKSRRVPQTSPRSKGRGDLAQESYRGTGFASRLLRALASMRSKNRKLGEQRVTRFSSSRSPEEILQHLGMILEEMGGKVRVTKESRRKLKCQLTTGRDQQLFLLIEIVEREDGNCTILFRRAKGDKGRTDTKTFFNVFKDIQRRYLKRTSEHSPQREKRMRNRGSSY